MVEHTPATRPASPRLIALNLALLGVLGFLVVGSMRPAGAQPPPTTPPTGDPSGRPRGEYTMVAGRIQGATASAIYLIDAANQELVALGWDRSNSKINLIGHRRLSDDSRYLTKPR